MRPGTWPTSSALCAGLPEPGAGVPASGGAGCTGRTMVWGTYMASHSCQGPDDTDVSERIDGWSWEGLQGASRQGEPLVFGMRATQSSFGHAAHQSEENKTKEEMPSFLTQDTHACRRAFVTLRVHIFLRGGLWLLPTSLLHTSPAVSLPRALCSEAKVPATMVPGGCPLPLWRPPFSSCPPVLFMPKRKHQAGPLLTNPLSAGEGPPEQRQEQGQAWRGAREPVPSQTPASKSVTHDSSQTQDGLVSSEAAPCIADVCAENITIVTMTIVIMSSSRSRPALSPHRETLSYCLGTHRTGVWETALGRPVLQATIEGTASRIGKPKE